ncbi:MAG TPA: hypothetical protein VHO26_11410 [Propionibacteriaceae bacterium]|nr:hypothetical protein [Propionibacteriaceae bacterium]
MTLGAVALAFDVVARVTTWVVLRAVLLATAVVRCTRALMPVAAWVALGAVPEGAALTVVGFLVVEVVLLAEVFVVPVGDVIVAE